MMWCINHRSRPTEALNPGTTEVEICDNWLENLGKSLLPCRPGNYVVKRGSRWAVMSPPKKSQIGG